jgi:hypothetical protein
MSLERRQLGKSAAKSLKTAKGKKRLSCEAWGVGIKFTEIHGGNPGEPIGSALERAITLWNPVLDAKHRQRNTVLLVYTYMRLNGILDIGAAASRLAAEIQAQDWTAFGGQQIERYPNQ